MRAGSKGVQQGMTLIEVLVALLILTVGLLGAAAVQLNALKYTDSSRMTSQASFIAYDMMDRIRANSGANYTITPPISANLGNARDQDLYDFTTSIVNFGGPTATGSITLNQRVYTITITWSDARAANTANAQRSFVLSSRAAVDPVVTP
ncbi:MULTISPECIES: type IV pilus modification protein PilV [Pseudomonas]|uniref:type IV pilus modification protein PilV n=1 Tax=Pseudomonas TaxID=286 RepID=UPI001B338139|nr:MULTISPECIES: type IV pilus modification protein PilV [Pseudomonas]MBP5947208.1 type IV pilus modification protein PilV [Pseudomonas sp. P9(2020)]MBP5958917.1 type IV pilus modification protein PilV [Pseudomonas anatoliensis]MBZ9565361.1 type IV pilus modification protein PilV [Pseudomonas sp. P116]